VEDPSPLKIWLAARQVGKSFAVAVEAIRESLMGKCANLVLSSSQRQSQEVMEKVYSLLRYLRVRSAETIRAEGEKREEVRLPNGSRVISLPASPDTVRGFSGNVFLDEFAFHRDGREIWRAMYPAVTRGYRVRVTSTPNGRQNMFHELWSDDGNGFSRHRTDIHEARAEGLAIDVDGLRRGIGDPVSWAQEFECRFIDEATAYITYGMIAACEDEGASKDAPVFGPAAPGPLYLGVDVGRRRDLTVFWLLERTGDVLWTRMVREMDRAPFRAQREFLYWLLDGQALGPSRGEARVLRACVDSSGMGGQLAEEAAERFGPRVEAVAFTQAVKEDLAVTLRRRFEERAIRVPSDPAIREDIHSVRKFTTAAGHARFEAERSGGSHADRFWALALAVHAAGGRREAPVEYEPISGRRETSRRGCW